MDVRLIGKGQMEVCIERLFYVKHKVFLVSAPDGYRTSLSFGKVFLNPCGEKIIVADKINNQPVNKDGRFILVIPQDLLADRFVKAIHRIDVIDL